MQKLMHRLALVGGLLVGTVLATSGPAEAQTNRRQAERAQAAETKPAGETKDVLVFRTGRSVEGKILEETDQTIKIRIVGPGGISVETTYNKSDILSIDRDIPVQAAEEPAPAPARRGQDRSGARATGAAEEGAARIFVIEIKGEFGRDISATPLRQIMSEAKALRPDILVIKLDTDFKYLGEERPEFEARDAGAAYNQLETARQLQTMLTDEIRDDPEWEVKPRLVAWVKRALGGSAFLPFVCPEIYYHPDGRHGGIGYLEFIFGSMGDEVVREKQFSLRLARAEGLAIKGGHDHRIIKAMSRADYVLSVRFVGGEPEFLERYPNGEHELLLVDDAKESEGRRDTWADVIRFRGNDVLTLDAEMAYRLRVSRGQARTIEDLARHLGVARNYVLLESRTDRILSNWSKSVTEAERNFFRLWREYNETAIQGDYQERTAARGKRIRILEQIRAELLRYGEAINPRAIEGAPEDWETQINLLIEQLKLQQRLDRR